MAFGSAATPSPQQLQGTSAPSYKSHQELKTALHRDLLNKIDLERLTSLQDVRARTQVQNVIYDLIGAANVPLSSAEKERICREVLHEVFGLGPLEPLLQDASITEILVNTHRRSEEHTSELQSLAYLVCRLLLEKKKKKITKKVPSREAGCHLR